MRRPGPPETGLVSAAEAPRPTVGFIGLGTIGRPIATTIRRAGYPLVVFDPDQRAMGHLIELGATGRATPAEVAAASDVVVTMVPDAPDVERAALGEGGIVEGIRPGSLYMDMSTIDPATTRRVGAAIALRGARMVDCPVGRTVDHAWRGELAIMMGGDPKDVEEVRPILERVGDSLTYCGPLGNGSAMKLVNNFISAGNLAILSEALAFGVRAGLKLETIMELVGSTYAGGGMLTGMLPARAFRGDFTPGFMTRLSHKDQRLALTLAEAAGLDAPVGRAVFETLGRTLAAGYDRDDFTSMLRVNEAKAGVKVRLAGYDGSDGDEAKAGS